MRFLNFKIITKTSFDGGITWENISSLPHFSNSILNNFDCNWEGTMSDIMYDPAQCRNITLDIRYVLFIIDKFAGAKNLVDEMVISK
ncbi:MAG: hypothetical protein COZ21_12015 [Bacteroidetes bacterium CG_4_10_14_3_um_filter_31_20]|nr:MAG: hypothetical protein COZ21_12015 [Bacteroidetes bacterium CG_4_10_14_3_um_filter_31_20]